MNYGDTILNSKNNKYAYFYLLMWLIMIEIIKRSDSGGFHKKISNLEIIGFAADYYDSSERQIKVSKLDFVVSDQTEFHTIAGHISNLILGKLYPIDLIYNYLIIIHLDKTADIYINYNSYILGVVLKKSIRAGDLLAIKDMADIDSLKFKDITIEKSDSIIFCFKHAWKFGIYYNLLQTDGKNVLDVDKLYAELGACYKYLLFQEEYSIVENHPLFGKMLNDGWFPFIQLLGGDYRKLSKIYENINKLPNALSEFVNLFDEKWINKITNKWWDNTIFNSKRKIIEAGINAFLKDGEQGSILCIKTLYSEIEGIMRMNCNALTTKKETSSSELRNHIQGEALSKFSSRKSLAFIDKFDKYMKDVFFKRFDLSSEDIDLSRHSVCHGVASSNDYTKIRAVQSILVLDQLYHYLS